jgi:hypothetical protein
MPQISGAVLGACASFCPVVHPAQFDELFTIIVPRAKENLLVVDNTRNLNTGVGRDIRDLKASKEVIVRAG